MCEPNYTKLLLISMVYFISIDNSRQTTLYGNISNNVRASGGTCPKNLQTSIQHCYEFKKESTFPYTCTYKDTITYNSYNNLLLALVTTLGGRIWMNVRKNTDYGYYEWLDIGDTYGSLFARGTDNGGECIVLTSSITTSVMTRSCDSQHRSLCIYRQSTSTKTYCESYNEICGTTKHCHCQTAPRGYLCESSCTQTSHAECQTCEYKFSRYPSPTITLSVMSDHIVVTARNVLKLGYINNVNLVFCFTDVYTPSTSAIRHRFADGDVKKSGSSGDTITYTLPIRTLGPGHYWCDGFEYPNLNVVRSNPVIAGSNYGLNFVLNITIKIKSSHKFLPYNIHTETRSIVTKCLDSKKILSVRPIDISKLYNGGTTVDMIFHISTQPSFADPEGIFAEFTTGLVDLHQSPEVLTYNLSNSEVCVSEVETVNGVTVEWPTVNIGQLTTPTGLFLQENGLPITRTCLGSFKYGSHWSNTSGKIDLKHKYSETTQKLHNLLISNGTANEKNVGLQDVLTSTNDFIPYDIHLVANIFQVIATSTEHYDITLLTDNLNHVTDIDRSVLSEAQKELNATDTLLYNFDIALSRIPTTENLTVITTRNLIAQVANLKTLNVVGLALYDIEGELIPVSLNTSTTIENIPTENLVFATFVPPVLLQQILNEKQSENLVTAVFINNALFNGEGSKSSVSLILSMFVSGFRSVGLAEAIPIAFNPLASIREEKQCGFWNYGINDLWTSFQGHWKVDTTAFYDPKYRICNFTHMTHFALLVGADEDEIIDYLSTVGCVISLISITAIFITAFTSKSWRESAGTKILLNFSAALGIQMIVLLLLDFIDPESDAGFCRAIGIILHYIVISQFCWMLIISYLQYRKFVQVLVNEPQYIIAKSCVFAWLAPLVPVIAILSISIENYNSDDVCYPSGLQLYLAVFLPVIVIISMNMAMFVLIFRSILYKKTTAFGKEKKVGMLKVKLGVILFFLMGFSWIFGLLGAFFNSSPLLYIFCVTTTIQGFVLYLYFVVCNKSTRRMWAKRFKMITSYRSEDGKTSTTSQSDTQHKKY